MEARVTLTLLLIVAFGSISTSLRESPGRGQDPIPIAAYNPAPEVASVIKLYEEADSESRKAPVRRMREALQCIFVNNKRKCKSTQPGFRSALGRSVSVRERTT